MLILIYSTETCLEGRLPSMQIGTTVWRPICSISFICQLVLWGHLHAFPLWRWGKLHLPCSRRFSEPTSSHILLPTTSTGLRMTNTVRKSNWKNWSAVFNTLKEVTQGSHCCLFFGFLKHYRALQISLLVFQLLFLTAFVVLNDKFSPLASKFPHSFRRAQKTLQRLGGCVLLCMQFHLTPSKFWKRMPMDTKEHL